MSLPKDPISPATLSPKVACLSLSPTEYGTSSQPPRGSYGNQEEQQGEDGNGHVSQTHETVEDTSAFVHPPLKPFFTVIGDATSSEYFHPTVHYIFSDDDTGIITEAALQSLDANHQRSSWDTESISQKEKKKGKSVPKPETAAEHFIILDVEPTYNTSGTTGTTEAAKNDTQETSGRPNSTPDSIQDFKVISAHSLSPTWQVINTTLSPAPNFDSSSNSPTSADRDGNTVLMIEGTSGFASDSTTGRHQAQQGQAQTLEEMMDQFAKHMAELKKVVEASGDHPFVPVVEHAEKQEDNPHTEEEQDQS